MATATRERPILFSGPMVRAILDGRKTQTRRIVKPQPAGGCRYEINGNHDKACHISRADGRYSFVPVHAKTASHLLPCPHGKPGERLWVRETWRVGGLVFIDWPTPKLTRRWEREGGCDAELSDSIRFAADEYPGEHAGQYRPSIHMPRWACRIVLEITDVRVERVQDISDGDALCEGIPVEPVRPGVDVCIDGEWWPGQPVKHFRSLWQSINGSDSWDANPWVWALTFKRAETNQ